MLPELVPAPACTDDDFDWETEYELISQRLKVVESHIVLTQTRQKHLIDLLAILPSKAA